MGSNGDPSSDTSQDVEDALLFVQDRAPTLHRALVALHNGSDRGELMALLCKVMGPRPPRAPSDLRGLAARESQRGLVTQECPGQRIIDEELSDLARGPRL